MDPLRVLVVDDSALYRKFVSEVLQEAEGVEVVGTAINGRIALEKIEQLQPDLLTLDLEMPELDGLGVLRHLQETHSSVGAIVLSALSAEGATATTRALDAGAFDFALKPTGNSPQASIAELKQSLLPKAHAFAETKSRRGSQRQAKPHLFTTPSDHEVALCDSHVARANPRILAIGVSTGGPKALMELIPLLPASFPIPIVLVQHMPPVFTKTLADELNRHSKINVVEAQHGDALRPGTVYIAPGGKQMKLERKGLSTSVVIADDPPERNCRPSVDYLFRSVSDIYGGDVLACILTGMGDDGLLGCKLLKRRGAIVMAQNEATCVVYGMPRQIVDSNLADCVLPLEKIGEEMLRLTGQETSTCR
ncbi:chemotaxis response regulator protein-glutamate methylesterase [Aeoliella sp. ICT_H6.2]|uniref:Protein-glutamate methylesterase/protein-glutamine glutaminase n=1 Tax=Aeoliella straminimaris TaxID=2954799 RepID=A0A9X2F8V1_9BACT|nr:chemotaxis response regulator protein-glutamate methylesterase [Aeoliella straminimaris]MCO6043803.1 chemotaxis response regulator protein-glutamate methylesterase [Aeoliella straminimaris]